jgi:hypothetical protein
MTRTLPLAIVVQLGALAACQKTQPEKKNAPDPSTLRTEAPVSTTGSGSAAIAPQQPDPASDRAPLPPLPDPLPGKRTDLTAAFDKDGSKTWRTAVADLDGDGDREIVVVDAKLIRVLDASGREVTSLPVGGGILQLVAADLDGDKRAEVYAGWGQTREHMDGTAKITTYRFEKGKLVEEPILAPTTSRQDVVALVPMFDTKELLIAYFVSKYMVTSTIATKGAQGWTTKNIASIRTATSYARGDLDGDGKPELVVGRVYGDDKGLDGDAFVLAADGSRKKIPSTRGLRSVALVDSDGDGKAEIFMGDGWHQNYGQSAHGLLTLAKPDGSGGFKTELVEDTPGQYEIMKTLPAKIATPGSAGARSTPGGSAESIDGKLVLVTQGSHYVRVFWRDGAAWKGLTIAGPSRDVAVGDVDGKPGDEIVIAGDKSEIVNLAGVLR